MSRQPRFVLPGQPQHVIQRGDNRDVIFVADEDYRFYLEKLAAACLRFECELHAYVLMTKPCPPADDRVKHQQGDAIAGAVLCAVF